MLPKPERHGKRIDVELFPPCSLVTRAMKFAVMDPTDRNGELVAYSASHGTRLCEGQVVRIRWHAAAHKARLPQNEFPMIFVAQANRFAQSLDQVLAGLLLACTRTRLESPELRWLLVV